MKIFLMASMAVMSISVAAQNIEADTISWSVSNLKDERANIQENYSCEFVTYGSHKVVWIQQNQTDEFVITKSTGTFSDTSLDGSRTLSFKYYSAPARLIFTKIRAEVRIRMEVLQNGENTMPYEFIVSRIEKR